MQPRKKQNIRFSIPPFLTRANWRTWLPSRGNVVFTLVVIVALFWAQSAHALPWMEPSASSASTGTWPYQGRLANSDGTAITDTISMIFRLYTSAEGGTPLWTEQWTGPNSVPVSDGLFNVMLGRLEPIPQNVYMDHDNLWLGITAGTDSEMTPRVKLGSVPWAGTVADNSITSVKIVDGTVTSDDLANGSVTQAKLNGSVSLVPPDGSITSAKIADGTITSLDLADGAVTQAKLGAGVSLIPPDGSIITMKLADGAVTYSKQTIKTFYVEDSNYFVSTGTANVVVSDWNIADVPAGDVTVFCTFFAAIPAGKTAAGTITLLGSTGEFYMMPTHYITGNITQYVLHGIFQGFSGGTFNLQLKTYGETSAFEIHIGASPNNSDQRFGRHCTIIAGQ